jgi:HK97 family phage major capsid protein
METLLEKLNSKGQLWQSMEDIVDRAGREGRRDLTAAEVASYDAADAEFHAVAAEVERLEVIEAQARRDEIARGDGPVGASDGPLLAPEQRMAGHPAAAGEHTGLQLGKLVRGLFSGEWREADRERRAMSEGILADGGHLVPSPLAAQILDLARSRARVFEAGARTVPMTSSTLKVPRQASDPTPVWMAENATQPEAAMTFDAVTLTARTLRCLVRASIELLEDTADMEGVIRTAFANAFALELDRVALRGSGTNPEPRGVRNTSGVTITAFGGANGAAATNHDLLVDAAQTVAASNFEPTAGIASPRFATSLAKLKDSTGQPLRAPDGLPRILASNQVPTNLTTGTSTDTSEVYIGDWTQLWVGLRTTFTLLPLRERYIDSAQFGFFAFLRADVAVVRPQAFNVLTGVRP